MKNKFIWLGLGILFVAMISITSCSSTTTAAVKTTTTVAEPKLFLNIVSPADKSSITGAETTVTGETLPTAIVSVNGILVKVGADGSFSSSVQLELGPNVVQVVASDISDNQVGKELFVGRTQ